MAFDAGTVVGIVAIINAVAAAVALIVTTWFAARRAGRLPADDEAPPSSKGAVAT